MYNMWPIWFGAALSVDFMVENPPLMKGRCVFAHLLICCAYANKKKIKFLCSFYYTSFPVSRLYETSAVLKLKFVFFNVNRMLSCANKWKRKNRTISVLFLWILLLDVWHIPFFAEFEEFPSDIQCVHRRTTVEQSNVCLWKCKLKKRQKSCSHQNRPCDQIMEISTVESLSACLFLSPDLIGRLI